jgi:hypothetical protein
MLAALGTDAGRDAAAAHTACLDAAIRLLEPLLRDERPGRDTALDLLAADGLVTYAFEAAAHDFDALDTRTGEAMLRLARLAGRESSTVA